MKSIFQGLAYNLKGLRLGLKTPKLLMLGLLRFAVLVIITVVAAVIILAKYQEILNLMWTQPQSAWIVWLWYVVSWLLALLLMGISAVAGFLVAQVLFSAIIMDYMSQITEQKASGAIRSPSNLSLFSYFIFMLRQEIPRAVIPVLISLLLLVLGWFTPAGPVLTVIAPLAAATFLAWDNSDLIPARRMVPFGKRFAFLRRHLGFHLGFGLLFLIPVANILFLSFAPVGATLYYVEKIDGADQTPDTAPR
ncbi:MAG: EI24 domain-containing protein [Desulfosarcinaceae bacterium]